MPMQDQNTTIKEYTFDSTEMMKHREKLMDVEILLKPFRDDLYSEHDSYETALKGCTLATEARRLLMDVCEWLEDMEMKAAEKEAAQ